MRQFSPYFLSAFCFVLPGILSADKLPAVPDLTEEDFLAEEPIYITSATRLKQDLKDAPAAITIIDREMIEASSAINVIELLRLVPGFQIGSIDGTESTATYHGLSSQHNKRLQILIDGRSVYHPTFGGALWYSLPVTMDEIEYIEVIRGPNAASYGANSFSAVVNIKTFNANALKGSSVSYLGGERDTERTTVSHSGNLSDTSYRVVAQYETNSGYQNTYKDDEKTQPLNDDHRHKQISVRFDRQDEHGGFHTFEAGFKDLKFGGGYENYDELAPFNKKTTSNFQNYIWNKNDGLLKSRKFQFYHNFIDQNAILFNADKTATVDYSFRDERYDLEYQETQIWSPKIQTVWGTGFRYDTTDSIGWLAKDDYERYSLRLFGHVELKPNDNLTVNAGGFIEKHEDIGEYFSPRLALNYHINNQHTLRTSWSKAYRMPSFAAQHADQSIIIIGPDIPLVQRKGLPSIDPEENISTEIGYLGRFLNNKLEVDLRLAWENIYNMIDSRKTDDDAPGFDITVDPRFRYLNYGSADIDSAELQLTYRPNNKTFFNINTSYADASGYYAYKVDYESGKPIRTEYNQDEQVPLWTSGALFSHRFTNGIKTSLQYNYVDPYQTQGDGDDLDAFESTDIKIAKTFKFNGTEVALTATVKNIFDEEYQDFENDNLVGRETYFQIKLGLD